MSQSQLHGCVRRRLVRSVQRCFIVSGLVVDVGAINPSTRCKQNEHFLVWTNNISCTTIKRRSSTAGVICRSPPALKCRQTINGLCRDRPYHSLLKAWDDDKDDPHGVKEGACFLFFTHFMYIKFEKCPSDYHRRKIQSLNGKKRDLSSNQRSILSLFCVNLRSKFVRCTTTSIKIGR